MSREQVEPHIPAWRNRAQLLRLIGEVCPNPNCQKKIFPPRDVCPYCYQLTKATRKTCRPPNLLIYSAVHEPQ